MGKFSYFYKTADEIQNSENVRFGFCSFNLRKTEKTANTPVINHTYIPKNILQSKHFHFENQYIMFYIINLKGYFLCSLI